MPNATNLTLKYKILLCMGIWLAISGSMTYYKPITLLNQIKHQKILLSSLKQQLLAKQNRQRQLNRIKPPTSHQQNITSLLIKLATQSQLKIKQLETQKTANKAQITLLFNLAGPFNHIKNFLAALYEKNIALQFNYFAFESNHDTAHSITFSGELTYEK